MTPLKTAIPILAMVVVTNAIGLTRQDLMHEGGHGDVCLLRPDSSGVSPNYNVIQEYDQLLPFSVDDVKFMRDYLRSHTDVSAALPVIYGKLTTVFPGCEYRIRPLDDPMFPNAIEFVARYHGSPEHASDALGDLDHLSNSMTDELSRLVFFDVEFI